MLQRCIRVASSYDLSVNVQKDVKKKNNAWTEAAVFPTRSVFDSLFNSDGLVKNVKKLSLIQERLMS